MRLLTFTILALALVGCGREFRERREALQALVATNAPRSVVESTLGMHFTITKRNSSHWQGAPRADASSWQRVIAQKAQRAAAVGHTSTIDMQTYIFLDEQDRLIDFEVGSQ